MRLLTLVAAVALVVPATAQTLPPQLVGFTETTTLPVGGVFGLTNMCRAEFPGSRMCSAAEAQGTVVPPEIPEGWLAWVRLTEVADVGTPFTCDGWTRARAGSARGLSWEGAIAETGCLEANHVACCVPCVVGDVDGDGKVTSIDARLIQRAAVGLIPAGALRCSPPVE